MKNYILVKHGNFIKVLAITIIIGLTISALTYLKYNKNVKTNAFVYENQINQNSTKEIILGASRLIIEDEKINTMSPVVSDNSSADIVTNTNEQETIDFNQSPIADFSKFGKFTIDGMTTEDYNTSKNLQWTRIKPDGEPEDLEIDLTRQYTYKELEDFMINLAKYDNVYLDIIGTTEQGRKIYSLSIDYSNGVAKDVVLTTGQTHALEFAGSVYILNQYSELIKQAQTDPSIKHKLENVSYHAIPVVNPDGREIIINCGDAIQKSNANGVDINRNFNSINAGQKANSINQNNSVKIAPGLGNFPGYTLGSEAETQAVMKWLETYITTSSGKVYLFDYHQMGRVTYSDKPWRPSSLENLTKNIQEQILSFLNSGVTSNHYAYVPEGSTYGLDGVGGTLTDYFVSVADGFKYNEDYQRMMYEVNGVGIPLFQFEDVDRFMESYKPANPNCIAMTIEIGPGPALGYGPTARNIMNNEYTDYNFSSLLVFIADLMLEK